MIVIKFVFSMYSLRDTLRTESPLILIRVVELNENQYYSVPQATGDTKMNDMSVIEIIAQ